MLFMMAEKPSGRDSRMDLTMLVSHSPVSRSEGVGTAIYATSQLSVTPDSFVPSLGS